MSHIEGTFQLVNQERIKKKEPKFRTNTLINPIFIKIKKHITDSYWKNFMDELALNKFPKGFGYKDGFLTFRKPGKVCKTKLDDHPEIAGSQIIDFFHEYAARYSPEEKASLENKFQEITWKSLKNLEKTIYLEDYILKISELWELDEDEIEYFTTTIMNGVSNGSIKGNRILVEDKAIVEIEGVDFDLQTREFDIRLTSKRNNENKKIKKSKKVDPLVKMWVKYLKKLEAHKEKPKKKNKILKNVTRSS